MDYSLDKFNIDKNLLNDVRFAHDRYYADLEMQKKVTK